MAESLKAPEDHAAIMEELSEIIGIKLYPGDEHVLKNEHVLGIAAGTHRLVRARTNDGGTYPIVMPIDQGLAGEPFI